MSDTERVGWFVPDTDDEAWGEALAVLEARGFSIHEVSGGQMLSRRSFRIERTEGKNDAE